MHNQPNNPLTIWNINGIAEMLTRCLAQAPMLFFLALLGQES